MLPKPLDSSPPSIGTTYLICFPPPWTVWIFVQRPDTSLWFSVSPVLVRKTHIYCHSINTKDLHVKCRWHLFLVFCKALPFTKTQLPFLFASLYSLIILISRIPPWLEEPFHFLVIASTSLPPGRFSDLVLRQWGISSARQLVYMSTEKNHYINYSLTCLPAPLNSKPCKCRNLFIFVSLHSGVSERWNGQVPTRIRYLLILERTQTTWPSFLLSFNKHFLSLLIPGDRVSVENKSHSVITLR